MGLINFKIFLIIKPNMPKTKIKVTKKGETIFATYTGFKQAWNDHIKPPKAIPRKTSGVVKFEDYTFTRYEVVENVSIEELKARGEKG